MAFVLPENLEWVPREEADNAEPVSNGFELPPDLEWVPAEEVQTKETPPILDQVASLPGIVYRGIGKGAADLSAGVRSGVERFAPESGRGVSEVLKTFESAYPEPLEGIEKPGAIQQAAAGVSGFIPSMALSAINIPAGTAATFLQLMGNSYDQYTEQGVEKDRAFNAAFFNSLAQTPLEMAGNLLQVGALKNLVKTFGVTGNLAQRATAFGEALLKGITGEGMEEYLQQYPDEIAGYYAANPDVEPHDLAQYTIDSLKKIHGEAVEAAKIGALGGGMLVGAGGAIQAPFSIAEYRRKNKYNPVLLDDPEATGNKLKADAERGYDDTGEIVRVEDLESLKSDPNIPTDDLNEAIITAQANKFGNATEIESAADRIVEDARGEARTPIEEVPQAPTETITPEAIVGEGAQGEVTPTARFLGYQEQLEGAPIPLYNIVGGELNGSTVTGETLRAKGIVVPETPELQIERPGTATLRKEVPPDAQQERVRQAEAEVTREGGVAPALEPVKTETLLKDYPIQEIPVESLALSSDVPNFKEGASREGVVEPLTGTYERLGTAPIVAWQREDGRLEVITGRHRLDLAKRTGEKTIPVQVVKESDGFSKSMAITFDAEANIRDNQGSVKDYANYFRNTEISEPEASSRGLLARNKGRSGFRIGKDASDNLYIGYRAGKISEAKTLAISTAAPGNEQLQTAGIKYALNHNAEDTANYLRAIQTIVPESNPDQINLFGENEAWQVEADKMAKAASRMIAHIESEKSALRAAGKLGKDKFKEFTQKYGINPGDARAIEGRLDSINRELVVWSKWPTNPELVNQVREVAGLKQSGVAERTGLFAPKDEGFKLTPSESTPQEQAALRGEKKASVVSEGEKPTTGKPYRVEAYHSGMEKVERFDPSFRGSATGAESAKEGFFFAGKSGTTYMFGRAKGAVDEEEGAIEDDETKMVLREVTELPKNVSEIKDIGKNRIDIFLQDGNTIHAEYNDEGWLFFDCFEGPKTDGERIDKYNGTTRDINLIDDYENIVSETADYLSTKAAYSDEEYIKGRHAPAFTGKYRINFKNPKVVDFGGKHVGLTGKKLTEYLKEAKTHGHDGFVALNTFDGSAETPDNIYVSFNENNIELAKDVTVPIAKKEFPLKRKPTPLGPVIPEEKIQPGTGGKTGYLFGPQKGENLDIFGKPSQSLEISGNLGPIWYSQMLRILDKKLPNAGYPKALKGLIAGWAQKGEFKADELKWSGLEEWLEGKTEKVTKAEVLDYLKANQVEIREVTKEERTEVEQKAISDRMGLEYVPGMYPGKTKFSQWQLPGGENYRELLLTLPLQEVPMTFDEYISPAQGSIRPQKWFDEMKRQFEAKKPTKVVGSFFKSAHWNEPNVLAHVRMNDRVDADGKRVLFLEEVQSDWHQEGRKKGYGERFFRIVGKDGTVIWRGEKAQGERLFHESHFSDLLQPVKLEPEPGGGFTGVPPAPFAKTWHELVLKRMLRYAAENGYDKLAWTTGEQQAERYDLSKQVDRVEYNEKTGRLFAPSRINDTAVKEDGVTPDKLEDYIGKDAAKKMLEQEPDSTGQRVLTGLDLKVGGTGMKGFYDKIIPAYLNKYGKKWGVRVEETRIGTPTPGFPKFTKDRGVTVHSLSITDSMKEAVIQGQAMFSLASGTPKGIPVKAIEYALARIRKALPNAPDLVVVKDVKSLPDDVKNGNLVGRLDESQKGRIKGVHQITDGKPTIYFVASNFANTIDLHKTAIHEIVGHEGLYQALSGKPYHTFLDDLYKSKQNDELMAWITENYGFDTETEEGRRKAADEWFARTVAEKGHKDEGIKRWWSRFIRIFREWARRSGFNFDLSEAEIADVINRAWARMEAKGEKGAGKEGQALGIDTIRPGDVNTPEFRAWFKKSKVVDENGEPLVVYHGTRSEKLKRFIHKWGMAGHFGTIDAANDKVQYDKEIGKRGAVSVIPAYLSIQNPVRMSDVHFDEYGTMVEDLVKKKVLTKEDLPIPWKDRYDREATRSRTSVPQVIELLKSKGYDGIVYENRIESPGEDSWIPFSPTQIKSIFNRGTWDTRNPDISLLFTGPKGKAGVATKAEAERLEAQGAPMEEIRQKTGWFRAPWGEGDTSDFGLRITGAALKLPDGTVIRKRNHYEIWDSLAPAQQKQAKEGISGFTVSRGGSLGKDSFMSDTEVRSAFGGKIIDSTGNKGYTIPENLGKWRFEIDDSKAKLDTDAFKSFPALGKGGQIAPLSELLDHLALYETYPFLAGMKVFINPNATSAHYTKGEGSRAGSITLATVPYTASGKEVFKETLIHEVQHAIQEHEGFARGGSPEQFRPVKNADVQLKRITKEIDELWESTPEDFKKIVRVINQELSLKKSNREWYDEKRFFDALDEVKAKYPKLYDQYTDLYAKQYYLARDREDMGELSPRDQYLNLAGEYESRKSAERAGLTAEQRKAQAPYSTGEQIAPEDLIVRMEGGEALDLVNLSDRIKGVTKKGKGRIPTVSPEKAEGGRVFVFNRDKTVEGEGEEDRLKRHKGPLGPPPEGPAPANFRVSDGRSFAIGFSAEDTKTFLQNLNNAFIEFKEHPQYKPSKAYPTPAYLQIEWVPGRWITPSYAYGGAHEIRITNPLTQGKQLYWDSIYSWRKAQELSSFMEDVGGKVEGAIRELREEDIKKIRGKFHIVKKEDLNPNPTRPPESGGQSLDLGSTNEGTENLTRQYQKNLSLDEKDASQGEVEAASRRVEQDPTDAKAIEKAYTSPREFLERYKKADGAFDAEKFFRETGIATQTLNSPDLNKWIRRFQIIQDWAGNYPEMKRILDVQQAREGNSNRMSVDDRETSLPYYDLKSWRRKKVDKALLHGDRKGMHINNETLQKQFGLDEDERKAYWAVRKVLDDKLDYIMKYYLGVAITSKRANELVRDAKTDTLENVLDEAVKAINSRNHALSSAKGRGKNFTAEVAAQTEKLTKTLTGLGFRIDEIARIVNEGGLADWAFGRRGYLPHKWQEEWRVKVVLNNGAEWLLDVPTMAGKILPTREARQKAAERAAYKLVAKKFSPETVRRMTVVHSSRLPVDMFEDVSTAAMQSILNSAYEAVSMDFAGNMDEATQKEAKAIFAKIEENVKELRLAKGWGQHLIGRKGVFGYREDLDKVLSEYMTGFNSWYNKGIAARAFGDAMKDIDPKRTPQMWQAAKEYISDMLGEAHETPLVKRLAGMFFLMGDVSAAALNMTQNWTHAVALLRKLEPKGDRKVTAEREIYEAMRDVAFEYMRSKKTGQPLFRQGGKWITEEEAAAFTEELKRGVLDPNYFGETTGLAGVRIYQDYITKGQKVLYKFFTGSEALNRMSTFLAAYRRAKAAGISDSVKAAGELVNESHGIYGAGNRPEIIRKAGPIGTAAYTFMTYPMFNIAFLKHRLEDLFNAETAHDKRVAMKVLGSNLAYIFAFGGLGALPFAFLGKLVYSMFSDPEDDWEKLMRKYTPETFGRIATRGIPAVFGNDWSQRVEGTDILGAPIGFQTMKTIGYKAYYQAYKPLKRGDEWHSILAAMPDMVANPYKAFVMPGGTGIEGKPAIQYTPSEKIWKALGFTPTRESETRKVQEIAKKKYEQRLDKLENFAEHLIAARRKSDIEAVSELQRKVQEWNKEQKEKRGEGLPITWKEVKESALRRLKAREKGYQERLPKYMRPFQREVGNAFGLTPGPKKIRLLDYGK